MLDREQLALASAEERARALASEAQAAAREAARVARERALYGNAAAAAEVRAAFLPLVSQAEEHEPAVPEGVVVND